MTLHITSDLEPLLEAEAAKTGSDPSSVAEDLLRKSLAGRPPSSSVPHLEAEESRFLEEINRGPSSEEMGVYLGLIQKRQDEAISDDELAQLRAFTRRMEELAVSRLKALAELADIRSMEVEDLMTELQIEPPDVHSLFADLMK